MFFILFKDVTYSLVAFCTPQKIPYEELLPHPHVKSYWSPPILQWLLFQ